MTQRQHPAQRARDVTLGASVAALVAITGYVGLHSSSRATTTSSTTANTANVSSQPNFDDGGPQPGVAANNGNTQSRGS
ncbi:MAG TPA: hypothetical protein VHC63_05835 [Acidimicrobiales bacterium]|nr:hypothetical protein [Acidimicrobiales bacterium]